MRPTYLLLVAAAVAIAACADIPLGKIHDRRMDPGAPRPNLASAAAVR